MANDDEPGWSKKGEAFKSFQPRREVVKPTGWYIAQYWCLEVFGKLRRLINLRKNKEGSIHTEEGRASADNTNPPVAEPTPGASNVGADTAGRKAELQEQYEPELERGDWKRVVDLPSFWMVAA